MTGTGGHAALEKKLSLREIQLAEFEILKLFADFCAENGFRYYLCGGTLLGAVRHGGFIPWDDDIDVILPRPDYERFLTLFYDVLTSSSAGSTYRLSINEFDCIARIMDVRTVAQIPAFSQRNDIGLWIDLFAMDGMPSGALMRKLHYWRIRFLRDCLSFLSTSRGTPRRSLAARLLQYLAIPLRPLLLLIGAQRIAGRIHRVASKYPFDESEYCAVIVAGYGMREVNVRRDFEKPMEITFEGRKFITTAAWNTYLTQLYGDYMQLPPEDKRNKHHVEAWWR